MVSTLIATFVFWLFLLFGTHVSAQVISSNTQNPAGATVVNLDGSTIYNEYETVEYRFTVPSKSHQLKLC